MLRADRHVSQDGDHVNAAQFQDPERQHRGIPLRIHDDREKLRRG
jgi:hypothetical protein